MRVEDEAALRYRLKLSLRVPVAAFEGPGPGAARAVSVAGRARYGVYLAALTREAAAPPREVTRPGSRTSQGTRRSAPLARRRDSLPRRAAFPTSILPTTVRYGRRHHLPARRLFSVVRGRRPRRRPRRVLAGARLDDHPARTATRSGRTCSARSTGCSRRRGTRTPTSRSSSRRASSPARPPTSRASPRSAPSSPTTG